MIKTILVATDGSDHARKAVELASDIAAKYGAQVAILHMLLRDAKLSDLRRMADMSRLSEATREELEYDIVEPGSLPVTAMHYGPVAASPAALKEVAEQILEDAKRMAEEKGAAEITLATREGDPAKEILAYAAEHQVDLIAMGSRGLGTLEGLLSGSVSSKVSHLAECAVITVH